MGIVSSPAVAEETEICSELTNGEYKIYKSIGPPNNFQPSDSIKLKKRAVIINETRPLVAVQFKPEGGLGSVVPFQQPQIYFSKYRIDGEEKFCTKRRHADVFGVGERAQHYSLRCLSDQDNDGQFDHFRRYGELVPYRTKRNILEMEDRPLSPPQTDLKLPQSFALMREEPANMKVSEFDLALQSIVQVESMKKGEVTLIATSYVTFGKIAHHPKLFDRRTPSFKKRAPLIDNAEIALGKSKVQLFRSGQSRWTASAKSGFGEEAKLICGGAALMTDQSISVFTNGGVATFDRDPIEDNASHNID